MTPPTPQPFYVVDAFPSKTILACYFNQHADKPWKNHAEIKAEDPEDLNIIKGPSTTFLKKGQTSCGKAVLSMPNGYRLAKTLNLTNPPTSDYS